MTYRIKRIKRDASCDEGFYAEGIPHQASQWNAERDAHTNAIHLEGSAYPPKVAIKNDILPRTHEIYNCTTCTHGEPEHPAYTMQHPDTFRVKCKPSCPVVGSLFAARWSEGPRYEDIGCTNWDRRIPIPHKGYMPGVER